MGITAWIYASLNKTCHCCTVIYPCNANILILIQGPSPNINITSYSCTNLVVCVLITLCANFQKKITVMAGRCGGLMSSNGRAWRICWSKGELMYRQKVKILKSQPCTVISRQKLIREQLTSELRACRLCWWKRELTNCPPKIIQKSQKSALHSLFTC